MSSHPETLRERRLALVAACDQDREQLAGAFDDIQHELRIADHVVSVAQRLKSHPVLVGVVAVGAILAPVLARKWVRRAASWLPIAIQGYRFMMNRRKSDSSSE